MMVNCEWCITICLLEAMRKIRKKWEIILFYDNVSSKTLAQRNFWSAKISNWWSSFVQPRYGSQWLFFIPAHQKLCGKWLLTSKKAADAFKMYVLKLLQPESKKCFKNWFRYMQKCINLHGKYFKNNKRISIINIYYYYYYKVRNFNISHHIPYVHLWNY